MKWACVLAALLAIGASAWISMPLLGDAVFVQMWEVPLSSRSSSLTGALAALTRYEQVSLVVVAATGVAVWVAALAVLGALWTRYAHRMNVAASLLLLYGLALGALAVASDQRFIPEMPIDAILRATAWAAAAATVLATAYLFWRVLAEGLLTPGQAFGLVLLAATFGAAWATVLRLDGVSLAALPLTDAGWALSPVLLPLLGSVLAPWSYSRIRHT